MARVKFSPISTSSHKHHASDQQRRSVKYCAKPLAEFLLFSNKSIMPASLGIDLAYESFILDSTRKNGIRKPNTFDILHLGF